jgi:hypothetical protein
MRLPDVLRLPTTSKPGRGARLRAARDRRPDQGRATAPCKHDHIKYHWLREQIKKMDVKLSYINTHDQLADIFTKPLGFIQHNLLKNRMTGYDV